ncbi:hypothetical protein [Vibrio splendidus]|uniref:hypothetical protein n=1 Tax=Vibrio splendidus TaxID=29497 RepID=UPI000D372353|nr:hypothetical protein [Vibrio splendidus]PTP43149.1 hypothetical protein CWO10_19805 [Vibrio splendidus]
MINADRITQFFIGIAGGMLAMTILGMAIVFYLSAEDKSDILAEFKGAKSELVFINNQIDSVKQDKNIEEDKRQIKLSRLSERKEQQSIYVEKLKARLSHIEKQISDIFKWILGAASISGFLLAIINFHYKYQHSLNFFITSTKSPNKTRKRLVITNKKDRTETILCAYLKGKSGKKIELLDLSCEPKTISSFGHTTIFFECESGLESTNLSRGYRLYVVLGSGMKMKCSPIMQWKTARGDSLMALDRERRIM